MYCKWARKMLRRNIVCGSDCPILTRCPMIILEDANAEAVERATEALIEICQEYKGGLGNES